MTPRLAPPWHTSEWLNTPSPLSLEQLRGRVVLLHVFQMLCPGCATRATPQAMRVAELFAGAPLIVIGLHSVFEQQKEQHVDALRDFVKKTGIHFPIGIDAPDPAGGIIPLTMKAYAMQGTPTTVLIDAQGRRRRQVFGVHEDLMLGAELQTLLLEAERPLTLPTHIASDVDPRPQGCRLPSGMGTAQLEEDDDEPSTSLTYLIHGRQSGPPTILNTNHLNSQGGQPLQFVRIE